jgi:ketosteroid isomerase-like protein
MKFIMSLIAVAALSSVASAFAQEESPSPAPEEKASATVEDKPAATATPEQTKAQKKEETTATKSESPAAVKKETTTATKSASPAAATASRKGMSTEAALRDMENKWEEAIAKHDTATVESMMSEDFIGVNSKNKVGGRRFVVSEVKSDKDTFTSAKNEKLEVRMFGKDVAVVVGTSHEKGTGKDGKAFDRTYRYTDTWMNRGGKWQCVASQVALVSGK